MQFLLGTPLMLQYRCIYISISIEIDIHCCCKHFFVEFQNWSKGTKTCVGGYLVKTSVTAANTHRNGPQQARPPAVHSAL